MRFYLLAFFLMVALQHGFSQHHVQCGFDHYAHQLSQQVDHMDQKKELILSRDDHSLLRGNLDLYTINVVVHLVENGNSTPITDLDVVNVLSVLNDDFRRRNADTVMTRKIFKDVVGDAFIEFNLEEIIRIQTDTLFEFSLQSLPDYVKETASGGSDGKDPKRFMNIWVCHIEGSNLLGYAYPPDGLPNWPAGSGPALEHLDGVVIHDEAFKAFGQLSINNQVFEIRGRTVTHEVGHYLGLRHIWGDGLLTIFGIPNCTDDDGVEDTPMQGLQSDNFCDTLSNTCEIAGDTSDLPDMLENHMDYTSETCKNSFTNGQIQIMRGVLENERFSLIEGSTSLEEEIVGKQLVDIYPNPTAQVVHFRNLTNASQKVTLVTTDGKVINSFQLNSSALKSIDLKAMTTTSGVIYARIEGENDVITEKILVK